jgi:hypothetical protein
MISDLVGTRVAWSSPWAGIEGGGRGVIRGVYPDARDGRVARVIVQLETVEPAGAGGAEVGDLLDVNLMCVRVTS